MLGEVVVITKAGKPRVRLVPLDQPPRRAGAAKGKAALKPAFFDPLPDNERRAWGGG
jgi:antitoxin (DNA-binding transcriptional repressor) of toxin-antitoxin stability system